MVQDVRLYKVTESAIAPSELKFACNVKFYYIKFNFVVKVPLKRDDISFRTLCKETCNLGFLTVRTTLWEHNGFNYLCRPAFAKAGRFCLKIKPKPPTDFRLAILDFRLKPPI